MRGMAVTVPLMATKQKGKGGLFFIFDNFFLTKNHSSCFFT